MIFPILDNSKASIDDLIKKVKNEVSELEEALDQHKVFNTIETKNNITEELNDVVKSSISLYERVKAYHRFNDSDESIRHFSKLAFRGWKLKGIVKVEMMEFNHAIR